MEEESIQMLYEDFRNILLQTEPINNKLEQLTNPLLRQRLIEACRTVQADLMIMMDYLFNVLECETESDLELFLESINNTGEMVN